MPKTITTKRLPASNSGKKPSKSKVSNVDQEEAIEGESPLALYPRPRGRRRQPTAFLVFEINEKCLAYFLQDDIPVVLKVLEETNKKRRKLIFLSSDKKDIENLTKRIPFMIETVLLKENVNLNVKKKEAMEAIQSIENNLTWDISQPNSAYIGTLFQRDEMKQQLFKFGQVFTPSEFFTDPNPFSKLIAFAEGVKEDEEEPEEQGQEDQDAKKQQKQSMEEEEKQQNEENTPLQKILSIHSSKTRSKASPKTSPLRIQNFESEEKPLEDILDSLKGDSFAISYKSEYNSNFDCDSINESSPKGFLPRDRKTHVYYSKIKELSSRISSIISSELDKITIKRTELEEIDDIALDNKRSVSEHPTSLLMKRPRNFEEELFDLRLVETEIDVQVINDIFTPGADLKKMREMSEKIKNLKLEPLDVLDSMPIMKKVKSIAIR